jgi:very-short-patch-repair endonuclease
MKLNELEVVDRYNNGESTHQIAKDLNTNATRIQRVLIRHNVQLRSKSEAQKIALENGISKHPTLGRQRTKEEKEKISEAAVKYWDTADDKVKAKRSKTSKENWKKIPKEKRHEMSSKALAAIQKAAVDGSKLEKYVHRMLTELQYSYEAHKTMFLAGSKKLEVDVYIPSISTIIEIDGLSHFEPIWGEERLQKQIQFDTQKEGLIRSKNYNLLRIENLGNSFAIARLNKLKEELKVALSELSTLNGEYRTIRYE